MKVAVIGAGISGMLSAVLLQQENEVSLFEKNPIVGGHARTLNVTDGDRQIPVDTGFIVFNYENYPLLTRVFDRLAVPVKESNMSFGVSLQDQGSAAPIEYGTVPKTALFAPKKNLFSIGHWQMIRDIFRFNAKAPEILRDNTAVSIRDYLAANGYSDAFVQRFLVPMASSIWSTPASKILDFPATSLVSFFSNHGLLDPKTRKRWFTVDGGSREYVKRLMARFSGEVVTSANITKVLRQPEGVRLCFGDGSSEDFDQVVFACHSDQTLALIEESATAEEQSLLSAVRYQKNRVILHSDPSLMPRNKACWQSWVYLREAGAQQPAVCMSYWMNSLQSIDSNLPLLVTLNPDREPAADLTHDVWETEHPVFDQAAMDAQQRLADIQGKDRFWFAGAWTGYGFHEDGARSAVQMAQSMGLADPLDTL